MLNWLMLSGIVAAIPLQSVCAKQYRKTGAGGQGILFTAALFAMAVFCAASGGSLRFDVAYLPYSLVFAVSYSMSFVFQLLALSCGSMALTMLIQSYSLLLPAFYGIVFLKEPVGAAFYAGIVLLVLCLFLICFDQGAGTAAVSWKWVLFAALSFLGNGMCSVVQKMEGENLGSVYRNEFMIAALLMILPVFGVWGLIREKSAARMFFRRGWYWGALCGVLNGGVNLSVLVLAQSMPAVGVLSVICLNL